MKTCPKCQTQVSDEAVFCTGCGVRFDVASDGAQTQQSQSEAGNGGYVPPTNNENTYSYTYRPPVDPYDHTSEFDAKDISENKVLSMLAYIMGTIGIIIALLAGTKSAYTAFHVRQALKFVVVNIILAVLALVFCWTVIVPIACGVMYLVLFVIKIICFFQICGGKAKEPAIIRDLDFLK